MLSVAYLTVGMKRKASIFLLVFPCLMFSPYTSSAGFCVGNCPNLFLQVIRYLEYLSSGENRAATFVQSNPSVKDADVTLDRGSRSSFSIVKTSTSNIQCHRHTKEKERIIHIAVALTWMCWECHTSIWSCFLQQNKHRELVIFWWHFLVHIQPVIGNHAYRSKMMQKGTVWDVPWVCKCAYRTSLCSTSNAWLQSSWAILWPTTKRNAVTEIWALYLHTAHTKCRRRKHSHIFATVAVYVYVLMLLPSTDKGKVHPDAHLD